MAPCTAASLFPFCKPLLLSRYMYALSTHTHTTHFHCPDRVPSGSARARGVLARTHMNSIVIIISSSSRSFFFSLEAKNSDRRSISSRVTANMGHPRADYLHACTEAKGSLIIRPDAVERGKSYMWRDRGERERKGRRT